MGIPPQLGTLETQRKQASISISMGDCEQEIDNIAIRCFLCRGYVLYKEGDLARFKAHLANQHGAFFDIDYLLASCFMEDSQKLAISKPIMESLSSEIQVKQETVENSDKAKVKKEKASKVKTPKLKDKSTKKVKKEKPLKVKEPKVKTAKAVQDVVQGEGEVTEEKAAAAEEPNDSVADADMSFSSAADSLLEELNNELNSLDSSMDVTVEDSETPTLDEGNLEDQPPLDSKKKEKKKTEKGSNASGDSRWEALSESLAKQGIDITKSAYFSKSKQVLSNGGKYQEKFTEAVPCLPDNWKTRTVEAKDKGKVVVHKHFLSPEGAMMKTTMAVVEYLRIEGKMKPEEILEVAKTLKVGSRKLQKLFSNDLMGPAETEAETEAF